MKGWVHRVAAVAAPLLLAAPLVAGCGHLGTAWQRPTVVTSFYPLAFVADRVAGGHEDVLNLTHPGQEPHDLELSVAQTADIVDADLVLYERGLQPAVDTAVAQDRHGPAVDAAVAGGPLRPGDPHFWLDPVRLSRVTAAFTRAMSRVDPAHARDYRRRAALLERRLHRLDADYRRGLATCASRTIVVSHDAFSYLGARYGLRVVAINGLSPDAEPSPAHLRQLHDLISTDHITTVFNESLASPVLADTLAHDLGIRTAVLDPIEGLSAATAHQDYFSLMRRNLAAIQEANHCE
jgi:zinc transport system substrate-binding protein